MFTNDKIKEKKALAGRIRQLRLDCGETQERFAEILEISVSALKKIESGENQITIDGIRRLEHRLNVSADYLIFGKKNDVNKIWTDILNCTENDKFLLMMRLYYYFTEIKNTTFYDVEIQKKYDENIIRVIDLMNIGGEKVE